MRALMPFLHAISRPRTMSASLRAVTSSLLAARCRRVQLRELALERAEARRPGAHVAQRDDRRRLRRVVDAAAAVVGGQLRIARRAVVRRCREDGSTEAG